MVDIIYIKINQVDIMIFIQVYPFNLFKVLDQHDSNKDTVSKSK